MVTLKETIKSEEDLILDIEFPKIAHRLSQLWGSVECLNEIENLLNYSYTKERPLRQGFSFSVILELQNLLVTHTNQFPFMHSEFTRQLNDPWSYR